MTPDNEKDLYRVWSESEPSVPIFSKGWWLDAVAQDSWSVVVVRKGGSIVASMPYYCKKRTGFVLLSQPPLTQNLGPWVSASTVKYARRLAREKELMEALIDGLPKYDHFQQNWHYSRTNWLPFCWRGFSETTRYTYVIDDLTDFESVTSNFEHSKRKNIKKAERIVRVVQDIGCEEFYSNHKMTLAKQGKSISYSYELFRTVYEASYYRNMGKTLAAYDGSGNLHAALFIVFDDMSAYNLISTIDPEYRSSGAASLLVREAIRLASEREMARFDFEGSMIEAVERSFRQFGARQMPYHSVSHTPSRVLQVGKCARKALRDGR